MRIPKSLGVAIIVVALTGLSMALAVSALGAKGNDNDQGDNHGQPNGPLLRAALAPSMPAPTDPMIHGVNPGGVPWGVEAGRRPPEARRGVQAASAERMRAGVGFALRDPGLGERAMGGRADLRNVRRCRPVGGGREQPWVSSGWGRTSGVERAP